MSKQPEGAPSHHPGFKIGGMRIAQRLWRIGGEEGRMNQGAFVRGKSRAGGEGVGYK